MRKARLPKFQSPSEKMANRFLDRFDLVIHADLLGFDAPPWCEQGVAHDHYWVSIMDKTEQREPLQFDYWNSFRSKEEDYRPTNYEILSCVSQDKAVDLSEMWLVLDDIVKDIRHQQERINGFFTIEELAALECIQ